MHQETRTQREGTHIRHQSRNNDFKIVVGPLGVEPSTNGLCLPLQFSLPVSGSWSGLSLVITTYPYSLYTFVNQQVNAWLGITTHYAEASPNLSSSTSGQS